MATSFLSVVLVVLLYCSLVSSIPLQILYPLYSYPGGNNDIYPTVGQAASEVPVTVIINPDSGPEPCPVSSAFQNGLNQLISNAGSNSKLTIIGYVPTNYGNDNSTQIEKQVSIYYQCWGVKGIFFDEASSNSNDVPFYQDLYNNVKSHGQGNLVVINPGDSVPEAYTSASDVIVVFEGSSAQWQTYTPASYLRNYPATKFAAIIYSESTSNDLTNDFTLAEQRNIGYVFGTDAGEPNPYNVLPTYWNNEVAFVDATIPNQGGGGAGGVPAGGPPPPSGHSTNAACQKLSRDQCGKSKSCKFFESTNSCGLSCKDRTKSECSGACHYTSHKKCRDV